MGRGSCSLLGVCTEHDPATAATHCQLEVMRLQPAYSVVVYMLSGNRCQDAVMMYVQAPVVAVWHITHRVGFTEESSACTLYSPDRLLALC